MYKILIYVSILINISLSQANELKIATYNIRNFGNKAENSPEKKAVITKIIKSLNADLISLQEIVIKDELIKLIAKNFPKYKLVISKCGGGGVQHLGFLYKTSSLELLAIKETNVIKIKNKEKCYSGTRPLFMAQLRVKKNHTTFWAMAIHLKAGGSSRVIKERHAQLDILHQYLKLFPDKNIILLGDFNTTEFLKRGPLYEHFTRSYQSLNFSNLTGHQIQCSTYWWGGNANDENYMHPSLLDHIIVGPNFKNIFTPTKVTVHAHCQKSYCKKILKEQLPDSYKMASDHCPITTTYKFK